MAECVEARTAGRLEIAGVEPLDQIRPLDMTLAEDAQRLRVRAPGGVLLGQVVVGTGELKGGQKEPWIEIERPAQGAHRRGRVAAGELGHASDEVSIGVKRIGRKDTAGHLEGVVEVAGIRGLERSDKGRWRAHGRGF